MTKVAARVPSWRNCGEMGTNGCISGSWRKAMLLGRSRRTRWVTLQRRRRRLLQRSNWPLSPQWSSRRWAMSLIVTNLTQGLPVSGYILVPDLITWLGTLQSRVSYKANYERDGSAPASSLRSSVSSWIFRPVMTLRLWPGVGPIPPEPIAVIQSLPFLSPSRPAEIPDVDEDEEYEDLRMFTYPLSSPLTFTCYLVWKSVPSAQILLF